MRHSEPTRAQPSQRWKPRPGARASLSGACGSYLRAIFSTGNIGWLEALLSEDCAYTFSHKHLLSADMHSHTANGKPDVLAQLTKTSRSWSDVVRPNTTRTHTCPLVHSAQTATATAGVFPVPRRTPTTVLCVQSIKSSEEVSAGVYRNVYSYSRLMTEWECVETVTTNEAGLICGISRNRVRHTSSVWRAHEIAG